jgi:prepilin-type processing-associated H-X9-DG protein
MFDINTYPTLTNWLLTASSSQVLRPRVSSPENEGFYFKDNRLSQFVNGNWLEHETDFLFLKKTEFAPISKDYPTAAEMLTWLSMQQPPVLDKFVYLNGTDNPESGASAIWYVNNAGSPEAIRMANGVISTTQVFQNTENCVPVKPPPALVACVISAINSETNQPVNINGMPSAILYDKAELMVIELPDGCYLNSLDDSEGVVANVVNKHDGTVNVSFADGVTEGRLVVSFAKNSPRPIAQNGVVGIGAAKDRITVKFPKPFPLEGGTLTVNVTPQFNYDARQNSDPKARYLMLDGAPTLTGFAVRLSGNFNALDAFHWQALWLP